MYANSRRKGRRGSTASVSTAGAAQQSIDEAVDVGIEKGVASASTVPLRPSVQTPILINVKAGETLSRSLSVFARTVMVCGAGALVSNFIGAVSFRSCKVIFQNVSCQLTRASFEACNVALDNVVLSVDNDTLTCTGGSLNARHASISCSNTVLSRGVQCDVKFVEWTGVVHVHDASDVCAEFSTFTTRPDTEAFKIWYGSRDTTRAHLKFMHCTIDCGGDALIDVMPAAYVSVVFGALVAAQDLPLVSEAASSCLHGLPQHSGDIMLGSGACIGIVNNTFSVCKTYAVDGTRPALISCQLT